MDVIARRFPLRRCHGEGLCGGPRAWYKEEECRPVCRPPDTRSEAASKAPGDVIEARNAKQAGTRFSHPNSARLSQHAAMRSMRLLSVFLLLAGCASQITKTVRQPLNRLAVRAVVVYPVRVLGTDDGAGWRGVHLGQRLVDKGLSLSGRRVAFWGPTEIQVLRWKEDGWIGSNAVPLLVKAGIRPDDAVVARGTVERRLTQAALERTDAKERPQGGSATQETTWVCTVEVVHPSTAVVLGEFRAEQTFDPFAAPTGEEEYDAAPGMTHLLERLAAAALELVDQHPPAEVGAPPPELAYSLAVSPRELEAQSPQKEPSLDALERELWLQQQSRFLSPWLSDSEAMAVARLPRGMWVAKAPDSGSVKCGDVLVDVDGEPPLPQVLARRRLKGVPVPVGLQRGAARFDALLP